MFFSLVAIVAAIFGFVSGSLWLFTVAVGFLFMQMYPVFVFVLLTLCVGLLAAKHYWRW